MGKYLYNIAIYRLAKYVEKALFSLLKGTYNLNGFYP